MNPLLDADPTPPREECFDKITFRTSFEREDQYLILGGISHGYHAHPDGNSIIEYTDKGAYRIFDHGYFVPDTVEHNTLVIYRDGMFEPIPRLTGVAHVGDFSQVGMTQTYLNGYNGMDWRRNIVWNKEKYFLVIDEVDRSSSLRRHRMWLIAMRSSRRRPSRWLLVTSSTSSTSSTPATRWGNGPMRSCRRLTAR
jgi:hypothetical protein